MRTNALTRVLNFWLQSSAFNLRPHPLFSHPRLHLGEEGVPQKIRNCNSDLFCNICPFIAVVFRSKNERKVYDVLTLTIPDLTTLDVFFFRTGQTKIAGFW